MRRNKNMYIPGFIYLYMISDSRMYFRKKWQVSLNKAIQ